MEDWIAEENFVKWLSKIEQLGFRVPDAVATSFLPFLRRRWLRPDLVGSS